MHSPVCDAAAEKVKAAQAEYDAKWPNHCKNCNARGGFDLPGSHWDPPDFDVCAECVCSGKCPRCGASTFSDDEVSICSGCGFDTMNPDRRPENYECWGCEDLQEET